MAYYALIDEMMRDSVVTISEDLELIIELKNRLGGWGDLAIKEFSTDDALLFKKNCYNVTFNKDKTLNNISENLTHFLYRSNGNVCLGFDDLYHCNVIADTEDEAILIAKRNLELYEERFNNVFPIK